jgi:hypothetical protein
MTTALHGELADASIGHATHERLAQRSYFA